MSEPTDRSGRPPVTAQTSGETGNASFGEEPPQQAETPQPGDPRLENALTQVRIVAGALVASVLAYAVFVWLLVGRPGYEPMGLPGVMVAVLAALGVFDLLLAPVIERSILANAAARPEVEQAVAEYRKAKLAGFAFREAAAVFGLLIALFTGQAAWCYALAAATLVAMALAWPSRQGLARVARGAVQPR